MRKLFLTIIALFVLNSCNLFNNKNPKDDEVKIETERNLATDSNKVTLDKEVVCEFITTIFSLLSPEDQYEWLKRNGDLVCSLGLDKCIIEMHTIRSNSDFQTMKENFWNGRPILTKSYSVSKIQEIIGKTCYENHVEFSFDLLNDNMTLAHALKPFKVKILSKTYYSAPLFRSLIKEYNMEANDEFIFTKARRGNDVFIVFNIKVDGQILDLNIDITDNPTVFPPIHSEFLLI